jgi:hypothetical protein
MWFTGTYASTAAGSLLAVLDTVLPQVSTWSIYDGSAGTNCKVYRCQDAAENCLFYVRVDDNYAGYALIQLWEGWDAVNHLGVGTYIQYYTSTYDMRIFRPAGGWHISVLPHRFIHVNNIGAGCYCGQPVRYDTSKNIVLFIGEGSAGPEINPLANMNQNTNGGGRFLFDDGGGQARCSWENNSAFNNKYIKGIDGAYRVIEKHICNYTTGLVVGALDGVMSMGQHSNGLVRWDVVAVDGVDWECGDGGSSKYYSLVRKS